MNDILSAIDFTGIVGYVVATGIWIVMIYLALKAMILAKRLINLSSSDFMRYEDLSPEDRAEFDSGGTDSWRNR